MHYAQSDVEAAKEFEGFMVGLLAKQMRSSVPDGPWSNGAMATFADLFDQEIGKRVAEGGAFGLQDSVLKSLTARRGQADPTQRLAPAHPMPTEAIGHAVGRVTSQFGERRDPFTGEHRAHHGIDFAAPAGTPIRAAADGVVRFAGKRGGYGNVVIVEHADGTETRYAHCKELSVQRGAAVSAGENIATVGSTGRSTGPHLHFELRRGGEAVDPKEWIREKGAQVLAEATDSAFER
jgi:murein DD-endopeptidase MepM/ murein hydrolase activator NlpD